MASTNQGPEYFAVEKKYLTAQTLDEKIYWLQEMIRCSKKHKGTENMLRELKTRLRKFKEKQEKGKKSGGVSKKGIRKEHFQCVLVGLPNSGKSSILVKLTNAHPIVADYAFSTTFPEVGTMEHEGVKVQLVDLPAIGSENFDFGIINTADCLIIVIERLEDLDKIDSFIGKGRREKVVVLNKLDLLSEEQKRKLAATFKSKKIPGVFVSSVSNFGIRDLKERIFGLMHVIRVYTKEPGKDKAKEPVSERRRQPA